MKLTKKKKRILIIAVLLLAAYLLYTKVLNGGNSGESGSGSETVALETGDAAETTAGDGTAALEETSTESNTETITESTTAAVSEESTEKSTAEAGTTAETTTEVTTAADDGLTVEEDGEYTDKEHVALYLHLYGRLPDNYISKKEAENLGWDGAGDTLWEVAEGKSIGGSRFGNYEGLLPEKDGRKYYECDIDYNGKKRGVKRIVYSNDGLVYYTEDHYESFELLYE